MMKNRELADDYIKRAKVRLRALSVLHEAESWADVVRESQEVVELTLKALLRSCGVSPPRVHDVSDILLAEQSRLPAPVLSHLEWMTSVSRRLRRDRELAFYGAEDLTPSGFYSQEDADAARNDAVKLVRLVAPLI